MRKLYKFGCMGNPRTWIPSEEPLKQLKARQVQLLMEVGESRENATMLVEEMFKKEAQQILDERKARRKIKKKTPKRTLFDLPKRDVG
jgi:hypothetical protein